MCIHIYACICIDWNSLQNCIRGVHCDCLSGALLGCDMCYFFLSFLFFFSFLFFLFLFRATPVAYASSRARSLIGVAAIRLHHSHNHVRSKPHLQPTPQLTATPDPNLLSEARDQTCILMDTSWVPYCWATMGTPGIFSYLQFIFYIIRKAIADLFSILTVL